MGKYIYIILSLKGLKGYDLVTRIYSLLLNYGWEEETCSNKAQWDQTQNRKALL